MSRMFSMSLRTLKAGFVDRAVVVSRVEKARLRWLSKVGAFTRTAAIRSMRRRKRSSAPGQPPSAHAPSSQGLRNILFAVEADTMIAGPVSFNGIESADVPQVHEYGGLKSNRIRTRKGTERRTVRYPARPYMRPALASATEQARLKNIMQDTLK